MDAARLAHYAERKHFRKYQHLTEAKEENVANRFLEKYRSLRYRQLNKSRQTLNAVQVKQGRLKPPLKTNSNKDVFADVGPAEIAEYKKLFPNLEDIVRRRVHCTSCNWHIGTAPINETMIKMHPVLRVIQCKKCYTFYTRGEFECDDDGSEYYCRWCGQGGEVYCCTKCPKVYCRRCLGQNLSRATVLDIENNQEWICVACEPASIVQLRADYWALLNFIEKKKKEISNKMLTEDEFYEVMSKDRSMCCPNITHRMNFKRKLSISTNSSVIVKRADIGITRTESPINDALPKLNEINNPVNSEEISFQSDIRNTIICNVADLPSNDSLFETISTHIEPSVEDTSHSLQPMSQIIQQNLLDTHTENSTNKPVLHTISGFCVDLHEASQQGYYRLPNGKLIQVKRLSTSYKMSTNSKDGKVPLVGDPPISNTLSPTESIPIIDPTINSPTVNTPTVLPATMNSTPMNPTLNGLIVKSSSKTAPAIIYPKFRTVPQRVLLKTSLTKRTPQLTQINPIRPIMNQNQKNVEVPKTNSTQSMIPILNLLNRNLDVPKLHQSQPPENQIRIASVLSVPSMNQIQLNSNTQYPIHPQPSESDIESASTIPLLTKVTENPKIPDLNPSSHPPDNEICITSVSTGQVNESVDEAKAQFENRVQNSREVCEHIVGKMKLLTNSTAFKNVKSLADVRDLIMHLSYLLTYAGSRFKLLQETCDEDMKLIGFDSDDLNSNDDEIEILEPNLPLIDLDSDENDMNDSESENFELVDIIELHDDQLMANDVTPLEIVVNPTVIREYTNKDVSHSNEITTQSIIEVVNIFENGTKRNEENYGRNKNIDLPEKSHTRKESLVDKDTINQDTEMEWLQVNPSGETNSDITINEGGILTKYSVNMTKNLLTNTSCPLEMPEEKFRSIFRLSRESFKFVLDEMQLKLNMDKNKSYIPPILRLAATVRYLAEGNLQQWNDKDFSLKMSETTIFLIIGEVINILDSMSAIFIYFNQSKDEKRKCRQYYYLTTGFPGVIGCIDGTHVNIIRPTSNDFLFRNKKGNYSLNIMISCDYKLLINSVVANRGGYSDDSSVWSMSRDRRFFAQEYKAGHKNSLLIGDSGYPLEPWLMTPYKLALPGSKEAKFNEAHSKCKASIKRCFGILKGRFRCMLSEKPVFANPKKVAQIINVACMLHNICIKRNVEFDEALFVSDEDDFDYNVNTYTSENLLFEAEAIRDRIKNVL